MNKVMSAKPLVFNLLGGALILGGLWFTYSDSRAPSAAPFEQPAKRFATKQVSIDEARALITAGALVIDVRDKAVSGSAHLPGALLIPLEVLEARLKAMEVAKTQSIIVYCGQGSTLGPEAAHILTQAGYTAVANLAPGLNGWRDAGLPVQSS